MRSARARITQIAPRSGTVALRLEPMEKGTPSEHRNITRVFAAFERQRDDLSGTA